MLTERSRYWKTREEFSRACGVSARVLDDLETGRRSNYLPSTLAAVDVALGWAPGTCLRVAQGGRVRRQTDPAMTRILGVWPRLSVDARAMLADIAERAAREQ